MNDRIKFWIVVLLVVAINISGEQMFGMPTLWTLVKIPLYLIFYLLGSTLGLLGWGFGVFGLWFILIIILVVYYRHAILTHIPIAGSVFKWWFGRTKGKGAIRQRAREASKIIWWNMFDAIAESTQSGILSRFEWLRTKDIRWRIPPGRELPIFVKYRLLMFTLFDWSLRLDTFHAKRSTIHYSAVPSARVMQTYVREYPNLKVLLETMKQFRSSQTSGEEGWGYISKSIAETMSELWNHLVKMRAELDLEIRPQVWKDWAPRRDTIVEIGQRIVGLSGMIDTHYKEFENRLQASKAHNALKYLRLRNYDMYNAAGKYVHAYKVVPAGTRVERNGAITTLSKPTEVDLFGYVIDDLNEALDKFGKPTTTPRRVIKEDRIKITDYDNVEQMLTWMGEDWDGFVRDIRSGYFHTMTRNAEDYIREFGRKNFDDARITRQGSGNAFDLRALPEPGLFVYWGRKKIEGISPDDVSRDNPFPTLSTIGMSKFIIALIRQKMISYEEAKVFMRTCPSDIPPFESIRNWLAGGYVVGTLAEAEEGGK